MAAIRTRVRRPVVRENAEQYLLLTLVSFAVSVTLTRLFLSLTGYPQIGGGGLHIAHVLWGGLLLFVATLLLLTLANQWVQSVGAVLGGVGVGLFIDEVGKFITQSNDYFYPLAAPIIYAFFLLTVLIYLQVRRAGARDARDELYYVLDALGEVLDHDLEPEERAALESRLRFVAGQGERADLAKLARELLDYVASGSLDLAPSEPNLWERWNKQVERWLSHLLRPRRLKALLVLGMLTTGVLTFGELATFVSAALFPGFRSALIAGLAAQGGLSAGSPAWTLARMALEGLVGLLLLFAAALLAFGRDRRGLQIGHLALLVALTTVNLLLFYFDQFTTVITAIVQLGLLLGVSYYRKLALEAEDVPKKK